MVVLALCAVVAVAVALLRARRSSAPKHVDAAELGLRAGTGVVVFSSPYCRACERWRAALHDAGVEFARVDVVERPELARKYRIATTPLVLAVDAASGEVVDGFSDEPNRGRVAMLSEHAKPASHSAARASTDPRSAAAD
jgi:glutaredoxin